MHTVGLHLTSKVNRKVTAKPKRSLQALMTSLPLKTQRSLWLQNKMAVSTHSHGTKQWSVGTKLVDKVTKTGWRYPKRLTKKLQRQRQRQTKMHEKSKWKLTAKPKRKGRLQRTSNSVMTQQWRRQPRIKMSSTRRLKSSSLTSQRASVRWLLTKRRPSEKEKKPAAGPLMRRFAALRRKMLLCVLKKTPDAEPLMRRCAAMRRKNVFGVRKKTPAAGRGSLLAKNGRASCSSTCRRGSSPRS